MDSQIPKSSTATTTSSTSTDQDTMIGNSSDNTTHSNNNNDINNSRFVLAGCIAANVLIVSDNACVHRKDLAIPPPPPPTPLNRWSSHGYSSKKLNPPKKFDAPRRWSSHSCSMDSPAAMPKRRNALDDSFCHDDDEAEEFAQQ